MIAAFSVDVNLLSCQENKSALPPLTSLFLSKRGRTSTMDITLVGHLASIELDLNVQDSISHTPTVADLKHLIRQKGLWSDTDEIAVTRKVDGCFFGQEFADNLSLTSCGIVDGMKMMMTPAPYTPPLLVVVVNPV